jgi:hypothetical protein
MKSNQCNIDIAEQFEIRSKNAGASLSVEINILANFETVTIPNAISS